MSVLNSRYYNRSKVKDLRFSTTDILGRIGLVFSGLFILLFAFFVFRWGLANTAAKQADNIELAELAVGMSPNDPEAQYAAAKLLENSFEPQDYEKALAHYESAVALSPHKYFAWLELAKAHESRGNSDQAMDAFRQAEKLAPNYAVVQWSLGNALIRRGDTSGGLELLSSAARRNQVYSGPLIALIFQLNGGDLAATRSATGDSNAEKSALVRLLSGKKLFDDAFNIWNEIPAEEKAGAFAETGSALLSALTAEHRYVQSIAVKNDLELNDLRRPERIFNGSFEAPIKPLDGELFDWQISGGESPTVVLTDGQTKDGKYSLLLVFDPAHRGKSVKSISQALAVKPGKRYVFETWYKARLTTNAEFRWVVTNAADGSVLATGDAVKSNDEWTLLRTAFNAPANGDAIRISFVRDACTHAVCSVTGEVWLDALSLSASL